MPADPEARERRRRDVLSGGYLLRRAESTPAATLVGVGAVLPEVVAAADELAGAGIAVDVVCVTSADLLYRALRARRGLRPGGFEILDRLFPPDRAAPLVTVLDGHPHTLSFLSAVRRQPLAPLGVDGFGQSGDVDDLYSRVRHRRGLDRRRRARPRRR